MARQEKFKHKNFLCPLVPLSPLLCIVYLHYVSSNLPHWQKYLFNHKEQHSLSTNKTNPQKVTFLLDLIRDHDDT